MDTAVIVAAAVGGGTTLIGLAAVAIRGLSFWRSFRRVRRRFDGQRVELLTRVEALKRALELADARRAEVDVAWSSLQRSIRQARLLIEAANEAVEVIAAVRSFLPV